MSDGETFVEFKNSFSYGSRCDLLFKFMKTLDASQGAEFLTELLSRLGQAADDGVWERVVDHIREWQVRAYAARDERWTCEEGPFAPLRKPLSKTRLALFTSSGTFVAGHDPQPFGVVDMTQEEAVRRIMEFLRSAPQLSVIPATTAPEQLRVRHGGYDIRGARLDPEVVFPLQSLRALQGEGLFGALAGSAYSFVGAASQTRMRRECAPQWAELLRQRQVDAVLLVPV